MGDTVYKKMTKREFVSQFINDKYEKRFREKEAINYIAGAVMQSKTKAAKGKRVGVYKGGFE